MLIPIIRGLHDEIGHWRFATTSKIISDRFWWPKIRMDVAHFVRNCESFQKANPQEKNVPNGRMPVSGLFHAWSIDFAGPFEETTPGKKYILLAVENLPSWSVARAMGTNYFNISGMIKFLQEQICQLYGNPIRIFGNDDSKFDCVAVRDYASVASIDWKIISAYNRRRTAKLERMVGTLKRAVLKVLTAARIDTVTDI